MRHLLLNQDPQDGGQNPTEGEENKSAPESSKTSSPPTAPAIVKSGKRSSPKDSKDLETRLSEVEAQRDEFKSQLEKLQGDLHAFSKTSKGGSFWDDLENFLGWKK